MKKLFFLLSIASFSLPALSQNHVDALRYSMLQYGGTSRFVASGGAFGALGADFSVLSTNPAGIGMFKKSELTFTPSIQTTKTSSSFNSLSNEDMKYNFNFSNMGMLFSIPTGYSESNSWKSIQFGFGYNRINSFHNRMVIEGPNHKTSLMDDYLAKANGIHYNSLDEFDTKLAWMTYLLDTLGGNNHYVSPVPPGGIQQRKDMTTWGAMNEMVVSFGGNYDDKFYLGATIGFPFIRYIEESTYSEWDIADTINGFKRFDLNDNLTTTGSGVNFKLGMIYRPFDWVRVGAAVHTPTFYSMSDEYSRKIKSFFDNGMTYSSESPQGDFNYQLTTPMRAMGSIAFLFGKMGFISADYEFVDYSEARLRTDGSSGVSSVVFADANNTIRNTYTTANNLRFGGELNLSPIAVRAGYGLYGNPFKSGLNNAERSVYSFGLGMREKDYFIDFTYSLTQSSEDYYLYPSVGDAAKLDIKSSAFLMTFGIKF